jgi:type VI secretion system protein ImpG
MIEAFAFLAGRVHLKIDDEFPEITESLLNVLYPHYLSPIPSMSIVQFSIDPGQGKITTGYQVPDRTPLFSRPIQGTPCRFRTCYPVTLWPLAVASASLEAPDRVESRGKQTEGMIRLSLRCLNETKLSDLKFVSNEKPAQIESLRFYLNGEPQLVYPLYELLLNQAVRVELRPRSSKRAGTAPSQPPSITLSPGSLKPVGFGSDGSMLPYTARSFSGYRLLSEYFAFPEKFLFVDVTGIGQAARAGFGEEFDILIYVRDLPSLRSNVEAGTFQLGCTPIVNLFQKIAEPIQLTQQQHEYQVVPDIHRQMATEIYSIDSVTTTDPYLKKSRSFQPFYSVRHALAREQERTFWYATRRASQREEDPGTEVFLSLVDLGFSPSVPAADAITVHVTCTNRDLPGKLPFGGREGDFEVEGARALSRVRCLKKPTSTLRPALRRGVQWRLISHLSLNHLSIVQGDQDGAPDALQEILLLYDFMDSAATRKQISGITRVSSRRVVRQMGTTLHRGLVRGIETSIELDEDQYVGSGTFLFASVLEHFLGLYASLNSFNQLVVKTRQREGVLRQWPPRTGEQILL